MSEILQKRLWNAKVRGILRLSLLHLWNLAWNIIAKAEIQNTEILMGCMFHLCYFVSNFNQETDSNTKHAFIMSGLPQKLAYKGII